MLGFKPRCAVIPEDHAALVGRRERRQCSFGGEGKKDYAVLGEKEERTTLLWQSGDSVAATQLMVPGA